MEDARPLILKYFGSIDFEEEETHHNHISFAKETSKSGKSEKSRAAEFRGPVSCLHLYLYYFPG